MHKQYNVYVIKKIIDRNKDENKDLMWWADNLEIKKRKDGTFIMYNCEKNKDGSFTAVGFAPVYISKKYVKKYEESAILCLWLLISG